MDLESYVFVALRRPAGAPNYPTDELERIQEGHLANLDALREAGKLLAAGPFSEQPDDSLRGMCIFATSIEEARELMSHDPAVRAGRLEAEVMTWWTKRGSVSFQLP